ncbi:MAG: heme lyase CcmF/NrfE family subunit [Gemmatimonadota bacterium]
MITTLGAFAIAFALVVNLYGTVAAFTGGQKRRADLVRSARRSLFLGFGLLSIASIALLYAFLSRDFGVEYVTNYSSSDLPVFYTISAFWGGQKGSLLLWVWVLALFAVIVAWKHREDNRELMPYIMGVLGVVLIFFELVLIFVTPPFERLAFTPADGNGLNPMLQNPGMVFHPTTLYLGYIAFTIPFAYAIAALLTRQLDDRWIRTAATRNWTMFGWFFLTWGNLFGAQWAYVELGWGGFWMWDPVESASLMPWLTGTAFLHSVMIQEKKSMLKVWNMFLIIITFALTLFGTFLTRSGILSSVHTFSQSSLGPVFLAFIGAVLIFSFGLMANRMHLLKGRNELDSVVSRESSFFLNNLLFVVATFAVFLGTIFPLIAEAVRGVKITVAAPYFNQVNIPIFLGLLALSGICPLIAWRRASARNLKRNFTRPGLFGLLVGVTLFALGIRHVYALLAFSLSAFVTATIVSEFYRGARVRRRRSGHGWIRSLAELVGRNRRRYGGYIVHFGVVLFAIGVAGSAFVTEKEALLGEGESVQVGDYTLTYRGMSTYPSLNRQVFAATLDVVKGGRSVGSVIPQKRLYRTWDQPTTEPAIRSTLVEDLYVILVSFDAQTAGFKFLINPLMAWLWIGGVVLTVGTLIAMWPTDAKRPRPARSRSIPAENRLAPSAEPRLDTEEKLPIHAGIT